MPNGETKFVWYKTLNRYQWFVLVVASLGWMFDTMAQQLFNIARVPAMRELLHAVPGDAAMAKTVSEQAGIATAIFMVGWAIGGVIFGILGDRIGRAKTMIITILSYSVFTAISVISTGVVDFNIYRFLCGLGVGGQFSVGVSLVAEVMPDRARPYALGMVQALSAIGNMLAATTGIVLGQMEMGGAITGAWRYIFLAGALPAPLALIIFLKLKEPDAWLKARAEKKKMGSFGDLFGDPTWRRNSLVGFTLAFAGVVGLWGIGFFSFDLLRPVLEKKLASQGFSGAELAGRTTMWIGITSLFQNFGAFLGVNAFTKVTQRLGRRMAFGIGFIMAGVVTAFTFWKLNDFSDIFWMIPAMGFAQLALFGGYAIYLPELFPTRLRSTGTSFCYNVGRLVAALGPFTLGMLTSKVYAGYDEPMRYAGMTMCLVFLLGLIALPFAPETKGKPLPE